MKLCEPKEVGILLTNEEQNAVIVIMNSLSDIFIQYSKFDIALNTRAVNIRGTVKRVSDGINNILEYCPPLNEDITITPHYLNAREALHLIKFEFTQALLKTNIEPLGQGIEELLELLDEWGELLERHRYPMNAPHYPKSIKFNRLQLLIIIVKTICKKGTKKMVYKVCTLLSKVIDKREERKLYKAKKEE